MEEEIYPKAVLSTEGKIWKSKKFFKVSETVSLMGEKFLKSRK